VTSHPGDRDRRSRTICRFMIPNPADDTYYFRSHELRLETNDDRQLVLRSFSYGSNGLSALVSDCSEIENLVAAVSKRYLKRDAVEKKRAMVRQFKAKAIVSQIKKLAKEEQFDFATQSDAKKLTLFVRLSKPRLMEIDIPFNQFEETLPKLKTIIATMREFDEQGLRIRFGSDRRLRWQTEWTEHKDL